MKGGTQLDLNNKLKQRRFISENYYSKKCYNISFYKQADKRNAHVLPYSYTFIGTSILPNDDSGY